MFELLRKKTPVLDKTTWISLRTGLNGVYQYNDTWAKVIDLFKQRIDNFYLDPIDKINEPRKMKGEGFTIVTIHCVLIEMLSAFKFGEIYVLPNQNTGASYEYTSSKACFTRFLKTESIFLNHFYTLDVQGNPTYDQPFDSAEFYDCVRCGLMHEARTKKDWRIIASEKEAPAGKVFIKVDTNGTKIIYRTKLDALIRDYFENDYLVKLRGANQEGQNLRRFLARKYDHLHDIPRDQTYNWWIDP